MLASTAAFLFRRWMPVEGGIELHGIFHDRGREAPLPAETGDAIRMDAARGRLGVWLRRSAPIIPPRS